MKLNPFENKRIFRDRTGQSRTVIRDTFVNQNNVTPPQEKKSKKNKTRKHKKYAKSNAKSNAKANTKAKSKKMTKNKNRKGVKRVQKYGGKPMTGEPITAEQIAQGKTIDELRGIISNYEREYYNLSEQRFANLDNGLPDDPEIRIRINEIEPVLERLRSILQERIIAENRNQTQN